jgi:hypothetical protein
MKKLLLSAASFAVVAVTAMVSAPTTSEAIPAYARQTGAACLSCHFQAIPKLAAYGRNFKMNAMRDMGEQGLVEGDGLSLPVQFNASLLFKARIQHTNNAVTAGGGGGQSGLGNATAIQWPDESALLIGGRYGEHIGGFTEVDTNTGSGVAAYKLAYVFDTDMGPIAVAAGSSNGHGPAFVMNDPSNTVIRNTRGWMHRSGALDASGISGGSTGGGIYAYLNDMVYVAAGMFTQAGGGAAAGSRLATDQMGGYVRIAAILDVAGFDTVIGGWYAAPKTAITGGTATVAAAGPPAVISQAQIRNGTDGKSFGLDVQMQGEMGDLEVGFNMPVIIKGEQAAIVGAASILDKTGYYPVVSVGLGHAGVYAGYDYMKTEDILGATTSTTAKTWVVGAWYTIAQNVESKLEYNSTDTTGVVKQTNNWTLLLEYLY